MSASLAPIVLIFGAGTNVGSHVARTFAAKGYKVALSSRSIRNDDSTADFVNIRGDMSDPNSVGDVFTKVQETLGQPSVVVYNGWSSQYACFCPKALSLTEHGSCCKYF
jgi:NAD(P)-dependent dehydrogenase (short-subunit alcohol dehydrogenase family)